MHQMLLIRCIGFRIAYMYIQAKVGYQIMIFFIIILWCLSSQVHSGIILIEQFVKIFLNLFSVLSSL